LKNGLLWSTPTAKLITESAAGKNLLEYQPEASVETLFAGPKAGLRPIYEAILKAVLRHRKGCYSHALRRHHVIAQIKPATKPNIDRGFALKNHPFRESWIDQGGFAPKRPHQPPDCPDWPPSSGGRNYRLAPSGLKA